MTHYCEGSPLSIALTDTTDVVRVAYADGHADELPIIGYAVCIRYSAVDNGGQSDATDETEVSPVVIGADGYPATMRQLIAGVDASWSVRREEHRVPAVLNLTVAGDSGSPDALPALSALARVTAERDRARDLAAALEEQLARVDGRLSRIEDGLSLLASDLRKTGPLVSAAVVRTVALRVESLLSGDGA